MGTGHPIADPVWHLTRAPSARVSLQSVGLVHGVPA